MSRTRFWYVHCDNCGEEGRGGEGSRGVGSLSEYLASLKKEGWTIGKRDLCERKACSPKPQGK